MKKTSFLPFLLIAGLGLFLSAFTAKAVLSAEKDITFKDFLQQFPQQKLPYALDENKLRSRLDAYVEQINKPKESFYNDQTPRLDYRYFKFLPQLEMESQFSRMPMMAEPVAQFAANDHFAVLYAATRSFRRGYANYFLAVFDKNGKIISSNQVAEVAPENIGSVLITRDLKAELKTWHIEWKKSYDDYGLDGNRIKGLSYLDSRQINLLTPTPLSRERNERSPLSPELPVPQQTQEGSKTK